MSRRKKCMTFTKVIPVLALVLAFAYSGCGGDTASDTPAAVATGAENDGNAGEPQEETGDAPDTNEEQDAPAITPPDETPPPATAISNPPAPATDQIQSPVCKTWNSVTTGFEGVYSLYTNECFLVAPFYTQTGTFQCVEKPTTIINVLLSADGTAWGPFYGTTVATNQYTFTALGLDGKIYSCVYSFTHFDSPYSYDLFTMICGETANLLAPSCAVQYTKFL